MSTPAARIEELRRLVQTRPADPGMSSQDADTARAETDAMNAAIDRYASVRAAHLAQLLRSMDEAECERTWSDAVADAAASMHATFGDALHAVRTTPNIAALNVVGIGTDLEDKFYAALAKTTTVGVAVDFIAAYRKEVTQKSEALTAKWAELRRHAEEIEIDEEKELESVEGDLKEAADKAAYANRSVAERTIDMASLLGKVKKEGVPPGALEGIPSSVKNTISAVQAVVDVIKKMNDSLKTRRERYMGYFERDHASLAVIFTDTRHDAKEFVDKHGYDKVTEVTGKARNSLSEFQSAMQTDGQKSDATGFASVVLKKLDEMERAAKDVWDSFVRDHELEFFGAFGAEIDAMLVGTARIDTHYRTILSVDLHGLATRWMDDARKIFPVDLSDLDDATKDLLQGELRKSIDEYVQTIENVKAEAEPTNFENWMKGSAAALWAKIRGG